MFIECKKKCDVLVIGAGIAGINAAIEAAKNKAKVILVSSSSIFSGSSFYPGTWGLGLIGPESKEDEKDLSETIMRVGQGMANPELVNIFVKNINPAIKDLKTRGVRLKEAVKTDEKEFIPCFDHKKRNWNGLCADSMREVFSLELEKFKVELMPYCEALELIKEDEKICGAVFSNKKELFAVKSKAVILATGGYGGIFTNFLGTLDVCGMGQGMAVRAGAKLINMEFMQMMPGFIEPAAKTVFNEKAFKFSLFKDSEGNNIFENVKNLSKLLEERSTHGPFTSAKEDREIDFNIAKLEAGAGVYVHYLEEIKTNPPEFIKTYFDWLKEKKGLTPDDVVKIGIFAHAANGGIMIDCNGYTGIPGLYACGEVTGGMHGADRIGGLSSANGLVFGKIAGKEAALYSTGNEISEEKVFLKGGSVPDYKMKFQNLRKIMTENAMLPRNEKGLTKAINFCNNMLEEINNNSQREVSIEGITGYYKLYSPLLTALSILEAALRRKESLGSHYRED